jgi:deoxyadenosine/deoxycytidine kinase
MKFIGGFLKNRFEKVEEALNEKIGHLSEAQKIKHCDWKTHTFDDGTISEKYYIKGKKILEAICTTYENVQVPNEITFKDLGD